MLSIILEVFLLVFQIPDTIWEDYKKQKTFFLLVVSVISGIIVYGTLSYFIVLLAGTVWKLIRIWSTWVFGS